MSIQTWRKDLLDAMIDTDRHRATVLARSILDQGTEPAEVITQVLDPVLIKLGVLWGQESISLSQTFVAAKIAEDILLLCIPAGSRIDRPGKGVVVLGNIEDDFHSLGRRIIASFLRALGWEVHDLGNDVAPAQFVDTALQTGALVIGASAMMYTTALNIRKIREELDSRGLTGRIMLAVGGAVFNSRPELVAEVGGDGSAANAGLVDALCERLQGLAQKRQAS